MAKTSEKVTDAAANVKPYIERALYDAELREACGAHTSPRARSTTSCSATAA